MCGISGIYGLSDKTTVRNMSNKLMHRGPDGYGFYIDDKLSLGLRRLSIIDIKNGNQPIFNENKDKCVVFNGEIYNYKELRKNLEKKLHRFYTETDTEVIIHLYEEFGENCVHFLDGMFAFVIFDKNKLFIARDRFGIKPFYYTEIDKKIIFASEIKAIFQMEEVRRNIDIQSLYEFGIFGHLIGDSTMFDGIKQLEPGHFMIIDNNGIKIKKYWGVNSQNLIKYEKKAISGIKKLIEQGIKNQLIADVPIGVFLSGGVDSSILTMIAKKHYKNIKTFSVSDDYENEDLVNARKVAGILNTNHKEFILSPEYIIKEIPNYIYHLENPDYKFIFWYLVSKEASRYVKVGLSGEGSDEQFCGYPMYHNIFLYKENLKKRYSNIMPMNFRRESYFKKLISNTNKGKDMHKLINYGLKSQLDHLQLTPVDHSTMAASMEVRVPYLDTNLVEFTSKISPDLKINNVEKYILRKAFMNKLLPKEIILRKKLFGGRSTFQKSFEQLENLTDFKVKKYKSIFKNRSSLMLSYNILKETFIYNNCKILKNFI